MSIQNLQDLLKHAEESHEPCGLVGYPLGNTDVGRKLTYGQLRSQAEHNAQLLCRIDGFTEGSVILVHLSDHLDAIVWFWSVLYAGCIPAMSTPFSNNPRQRDKHILHLYTLLKDPICITRRSSFGEFDGQKILRLHAVESLGLMKNGFHKSTLDGPAPSPDDIALLMLTSGSTGNAKAVGLRHGQIITSVSGKASVRELPQDYTFLNWVGLDHVASMLEIHLQGVYLGVDQIHVQASDMVSDPSLFLRLIDRHRVCRSFAPNFFLARLRQTLETENLESAIGRVNLSCLRFIASGGEANPTETTDAVSKLLSVHGAPPNVIVPGFGMTETCAGSIFNGDCPRYDVENKLEFTTLGTCIPGIQMRITVQSEGGRIAKPNERGDLEVSGPVVFKEYYNNAAATAEAFTADGWFKTGDKAFIDSAGMLNLAGRGKEQININGVKYSPHEIETTLEEAMMPGATESYTVCFSYRQKKSQTESVCIIYLPAYAPDDDEVRVATHDTIVKIVMLQIGVRPHVLPLDSSLLQKTTLGKLSRAKIRTAFEAGDYKRYEEVNNEIIKAYKVAHITGPENETERILLEEFEMTLGLPENELGVETPVFEMGITSIDLIKTTRGIEKRLSLPSQIPIITMMTHPTVRSLARALQDLHHPKTYNPIVTLQQSGSKPPLWLIHPGVGEVLVFLNLAKYLTDRPVHALRARGFNPGESYFTNIEETVSTYHTAIKAQQPEGPYALAGYSYGSMLAFEVSKVLESNGDEVRFLGAFNLPPHIKFRMRQLNWTECLLNLAYFLDLITETRAQSLSPELAPLSRSEALAHIISIADESRWAELSLSDEALENWTGLAYGLQSMAQNYEPSGSVGAMDVFYAIPLAMVASSKNEWLENHLSKWDGFVREAPKFHEVDGAHYTMIGPDHVFSFQKKLRAVLTARGL
ncbi:hypothetical protein ABVK25_008742 [Lepraria finkii]|uniref:Carrier domain-containing protein n=1 Tax=Lepraria finkii TaxID=1340010 RepID=A0ABR4AZB1_9LECA